MGAGSHANKENQTVNPGLSIGIRKSSGNALLDTIQYHRTDYKTGFICFIKGNKQQTGLGYSKKKNQVILPEDDLPLKIYSRYRSLPCMLVSGVVRGWK
jgi:hypothetical protein